ncbi:MAG TPA: BTAD domain-containing putative transcriptional regulator, partial [Chloroflexota bacterium]|nr:BTAD domain-containing putative transcriptional regulator [Chloroflexota bacterium]
APELIAAALDLLDRSAAGEVREVSAPAPPEAPPELSPVLIRLFGEFSVRRDGVEVTTGLPPRSRTREVLSYLTLFPEGRRRDELTADVWPEAEEGQDVSLVHTTLHRLRQALYPELFVTDTSTEVSYRLNPAAPVTADVRTFEGTIDSAARPGVGTEERRRLLEAAATMYRGPFFPECYAEWAEEHRRRFEQRWLTVLAQLTDLTWNAGDYRSCLVWCQRLLEMQPHNDAIHARVLECYERLGEPMAGLLFYRQHVDETETETGRPLDMARRRLRQVYERLASGG